MNSTDQGLVASVLRTCPETASTLLTLRQLIMADLRQKAIWCYESESAGSLLKVLVTDGTMAMILYRLMQWSRRHRLGPLEMVFNKLNSMFCQCVIGRGAEFGPGFVLVHCNGVVINGRVQGGSRVVIEHQVTIGAERRLSPVIGDDVFLGAVPNSSARLPLAAEPGSEPTRLLLMIFRRIRRQWESRHALCDRENLNPRLPEIAHRILNRMGHAGSASAASSRSRRPGFSYRHRRMH